MLASTCSWSWCYETKYVDHYFLTPCHYSSSCQGCPNVHSTSTLNCMHLRRASSQRRMKIYILDLESQGPANAAVLDLPLFSANWEMLAFKLSYLFLTIAFCLLLLHFNKGYTPKNILPTSILLSSFDEPCIFDSPGETTIRRKICGVEKENFGDTVENTFESTNIFRERKNIRE